MTRPLTALELNILLAASRTATAVRVRDLGIAIMRHDGRSRNAARAVVSRTIRALEKARLVELHGWHYLSDTMTARRAEARARARRATDNAVAFYKIAVRNRGGDPWGSPAACTAAQVRKAEQTPQMYVRRVSITPLGRERLAATIGGNEISPPACIPSSLTAAHS
jgi:hypothetical protein